MPQDYDIPDAMYESMFRHLNELKEQPADTEAGRQLQKFLNCSCGADAVKVMETMHSQLAELKEHLEIEKQKALETNSILRELKLMLEQVDIRKNQNAKLKSRPARMSQRGMAHGESEKLRCASDEHGDYGNEDWLCLE